MNILELLLPKSRTAYLYDDYTLRQGLEKMRHHGYRVIPVINRRGMYVGALSEGDFLWNMLDRGEFSMQAQESHRLSEILAGAEKNPPVRHDASMSELLAEALEHNFVPVVDDRGCYIGIVKRRDIVNFFLDHYYWPEEQSSASTG
ncbi:MAG: CBS domain-containing protein [Clostridia bacterium]|nr:CBS domain-containing protein [Clostridia bacterium]